jgi:hypothetical protein
MTKAIKKIRLPYDAFGSPVQGCLHPDSRNEQQISFDGSTVNSTALVGVQVVRLWASADCHIAFGSTSSTVAIQTNLLLKANSPEYFSLNEDEYIAAVKVTAGSTGTLYITPMN